MKDLASARAGLIRQLGYDIRDRRVLEAMSRVPREEFIPEGVRGDAYEDRPLPIGLEQTISQPYIIALMTEALGLSGEEKVLELGTGSGYQTAILAEIADRVITVERLIELANAARQVLYRLGYTNIEYHPAGDVLGWQAGAPYDAIMVTAGAPSVPTELVAQLAMGGRMVIPVGSRYLQELCLVTRGRDGVKVRDLGGCRFVSLIGKSAWDG